MASTPRYFLLIDQGPTPGQRFELSASVVIGRAAGAAVGIAIEADTISRRHAQITIEGDRCLLADLNSTNGTFLNGRRIAGAPEPVGPGDRIQLGPDVVLSFHGRPLGAEAPAPARPAGAPATVLVDDLEISRSTAPLQILVDIPGEASRTLTLTEPVYTLGRSPDNDIVLNSKVVSRQHARLERTPWGYNLVPLAEATNPVELHGEAVIGPRALHHCDTLRIGTFDPLAAVTLTYLSVDEAAQAGKLESVRFGERNRLQIGRDPANDIVLDSPTVSRFHATIERIGQRFRVRDLRSSNATFLNDQRVDGEVWATAGDTVRVGPYRFVIAQEAISQYDESGGLQVDSIGLNKWVRKDLNLLQDISLSFRPREFIVIVGQSGGGKTTLLDAVSGYRPASAGRVLVNGVDAYRNFDAIRNSIGYVPQRDIIHMELTVYQALDYAARLRMPADTTPQERHRRVMDVLQDLDLTHRKDVAVGGLSGGQQKRVSIGVELLTKPGLFFLDEPTSGLDPGTETALMQLMRRLADQGRTIVLVTHATKNVMLADKVVFLARGGYLAWFGPPNEALAYFNAYRSDRESRTVPMDFDQIYAILDNSAHGTGPQWAERFRQHSAFRDYVQTPLADKMRAASTPAPGHAPALPGKSHRQVSSLRQFLILSSRNLRILTRDRTSLILMLVAAPVVSLLDVLIAFAVGRDAFGFEGGSARNVMMSFFLLIIFGMFVGGLSQMREIVKEADIYRRERLVNLKIMPYVFSKVWLAAILAVIQAVSYIGIHYLAYEMPGGPLEFLLMLVTMTFLAFAGMMLGLFASALAPNANSAPMIVIMLILPQIVLSGGLVPLPGTLTAAAATRWAFEGFMTITGIGSDVAADACWQLPSELHQSMTLEARTENCRCMGLNALRQESCDFPGLGAFYDQSIEEPEPVEPTPLPDPPPEPVIPPAPTLPADQTDTIAMAVYFAEIQEYQDQAEQIQADYKAQMTAYQAQADVYKAHMTAYQESLVQWRLARFAAVEPAEGLIAKIRSDYGWAFVNKQDQVGYMLRILIDWGAQFLEALILLVGVLWLMKRKDAI